jgi:transcriptional regulator with XRE-family HTH domain
VANRAKALGVVIDPSALFQYERGTVAAPDPAALWALSRVYGVDFYELVSLLVANRKDPSLENEPVVTEHPAVAETHDPYLNRIVQLWPEIQAAFRAELVSSAELFARVPLLAELNEPVARGAPGRPATRRRSRGKMRAASHHG